MTEFVEGWMVVQILGEGTYGEVKLLLNRNTGSAVAMKIIDLVRHPSARASVRKEALIHSRLSHINIISYYGQRHDQNYVYMFLEYASGGELFDRIEPDVGMPQTEAQTHFIQLLSGVEYLHNMGIAHRDLKPENLLLDNSGNLKISDFGMATFFRIDGKVRLLESRCGTLPYVAPEVLEKAYLAEPADLWSCGIILVALLSGVLGSREHIRTGSTLQAIVIVNIFGIRAVGLAQELPWNKPTKDCAEYLAWRKSKYMQSTPWSKVNSLALSLIRKILVPVPSSRYTLAQIKSHKWYLEDFTQCAILMDVVDCEENMDCHNSIYYNSDTKLSYSQPEKVGPDKANDRKCNGGLFSFSQPTQIDDLLVSTQLLSSQSFSSSRNCLQKLVRRMTRFFVKINVDDSITTLTLAIEKLGYTWKSYSNGVVTITAVDNRKTTLTFKINILSMEGSTLLDFRLSKGCGIEFKKCFMAVKRELHNLIIKGPTIVI